MVATIDPQTGRGGRGQHPARHGRHPLRRRRQQRRHAGQLHLLHPLSRPSPAACGRSTARPEALQQGHRRAPGHGDRLLGADPLRDLRQPHQHARRRARRRRRRGARLVLPPPRLARRVVPARRTTTCSRATPSASPSRRSATQRSSTPARATAPWAASTTATTGAPSASRTSCAPPSGRCSTSAAPGIALLGTLLRVRDLIETDIPKTVEAAAQLYALLDDLKLPGDDMKVLAPATWAGAAGDGTIKPDLPAIRELGGPALLPGVRATVATTEASGCPSPRVRAGAWPVPSSRGDRTDQRPAGEPSGRDLEMAPESVADAQLTRRLERRAPGAPRQPRRRWPSCASGCSSRMASRRSTCSSRWAWWPWRWRSTSCP